MSREFADPPENIVTLDTLQKYLMQMLCKHDAHSDIVQRFVKKLSETNPGFEELAEIILRNCQNPTELTIGADDENNFAEVERLMELHGANAPEIDDYLDAVEASKFVIDAARILSLLFIDKVLNGEAGLEEEDDEEDEGVDEADWWKNGPSSDAE